MADTSTGPQTLDLDTLRDRIAMDSVAIDPDAGVETLDDLSEAARRTLRRTADRLMLVIVPALHDAWNEGFSAAEEDIEHHENTDYDAACVVTNPYPAADVVQPAQGDGACPVEPGRKAN